MATPEDIRYISEHLRDIDRREIWASHRTLPADIPGLCSGIECFAGCADGVSVCLFGCNVDDEGGIPWLLATDEIERRSTRFLRHSRKMVNSWLHLHGKLSNYVHADNETSILWLLWLGFSFPATVMVNGEKFIRFEKRGVV